MFVLQLSINHRAAAFSSSYEYMTQYMESAKKVGRLENAIGWYHSHPGYGCWLSGIDCSTQQTNQSFQVRNEAGICDTKFQEFGISWRGGLSLESHVFVPNSLIVFN